MNGRLFYHKMLGFFLDEKAIIHVCHLGKCTHKAVLPAEANCSAAEWLFTELIRGEVILNKK